MASLAVRTAQNFPATNPEVYAAYKDKWTSANFPKTDEEWIQRARDVAAVLATDAAQRDKENKAPFAEVALLKYSGLTLILGPTKYGGGGKTWELGYRVVREVTRGDGSIGMLLGYHLLWSTTANIIGTAEQADRVQKLVITNNYFLGGAVNPRDNDLKITQQGDDLVFNGLKHFNTGGVISDLTVVEGVLDGTNDHIFAIVKTDQPGFQFYHNWDNIGVRLSESGSVKIVDIHAPWADALGWDAATKKPLEDILLVPFASLLLPTIQLIFANLYLGFAQGALDFATKYTVAHTRSWPYGGGTNEKGTDEFYILSTYGNFHAHLEAALALGDRANRLAASIYETYGNDRTKFTAEQRGEFAEEVARIKVVSTDTGLRVTAGVFEVTGARATANKTGLDRFWRDIRTHSLHDPVAYKNRELGRYLLLNEYPEPTWYT